MIPALAPLAELFVGEHRFYREMLRLKEAAGRGSTGTELLRPRAIEWALGAFDRGLRADDRRALASAWSRQYFHRLIPPVLSSYLLLGRCLPVGLRDSRVILDERGLPEAFELPDAGQALPSGPTDPFSAFSALLEGHLAPYIAALGAHARLSPRVLWVNAGSCCDATVRHVEAHARAPSDRLAVAGALLTARRRSDGAPNPLFEAVTYHSSGAIPDGRPQRRLRVCCLRYLLPDRLCRSCPRHSDSRLSGQWRGLRGEASADG